jgi:hypothetical protein
VLEIRLNEAVGAALMADRERYNSVCSFASTLWPYVGKWQVLSPMGPIAQFPVILLTKGKTIIRKSFDSLLEHSDGAVAEVGSDRGPAGRRPQPDRQPSSRLA